jgi:hypothetical protein
MCLVKDGDLAKKYKTITYDIVREAFPDLLPVKIKEKKENPVPLS